MAIRVPFHSLAQWFQQIPCAERAGNFGAAAGNFFAATGKASMSPGIAPGKIKNRAGRIKGHLEVPWPLLMWSSHTVRRGAVVS
jgi:hypothetical protein